MSIITHDITKTYGAQLVLDHVNINIGKGEIVGLLGPNGAGKSTLMKILTGYIPPTSGSAIISGYDVMLDPGAVKKIVGYLPEHNPLYLDMYIKEYLEFIAGIHKLGNKSRKRIGEIIEITGLSPEQNKKIGLLNLKADTFVSCFFVLKNRFYLKSYCFHLLCNMKNKHYF